MNKDIEEYVSKYSEDTRKLFSALHEIVMNTSLNVEAQMWAKIPSFYVGDRFVRLLPFKNHVNIEALSVNDHKEELINYTITPTKMLQIKVGQKIPKEILEEIFKETLLVINKKRLSDYLQEKEFAYLTIEEKSFILAFDSRLDELGYSCRDTIYDGICYGKYMLIYVKKNAKSKNVYARIYFRDNGLVLRFFFNNIDKHSSYIESSLDYIKEVFVGETAKCNHCKGNMCKFRKSYTISNVLYEKCNGLTFQFFNPTLSKLDEYIKLFKEFY